MATRLRTLARPLLANTATRVAPRVAPSAPFAPLASTSYKPALRPFSTSPPVQWTRKTASLKARPRQKTKTRKSASTRWAVLADGQFLRSRSNLSHGNTKMNRRRRKRLNKPVLANSQQANFLRKVMPFWRKARSRAAATAAAAAA